MITFVDACMTLLTVPPLPAPNSFNTTRSSLRKSSLNSSPISSVSVRLLSAFARAPGICASPSEGLEPAFGAELRASPLTFLRFKVRALKASSMVQGEVRSGIEWGTDCEVGGSDSK